MQKKNIAYWVVGIIGAVLIIVLVVQMNKQKTGAPNLLPPTSTNIGPTGNSSTTTPPKTSKTGSSSNTAYNAALAIYQKNGYRVQFSQCHGTPGYLVVPQGVKYMLDNRDNTAHTIKVGPYSYRLPAYGYEIVTAENLGLNNVTCDGGGAAQINIEK